ncbi:MAG: hypothetical protein H6711_04155 [Myxococcales bacterium]|nr:hypothetical protein [Myxococcales bacterium]
MGSWDFDEAMDAMVRRRAAELAAWELGDVFEAPLQAIFIPAFHPTLRLALIDGEVDVAAAPGDTLADLETVALPADEIAALVGGLDLRIAAPRAREGLVRDGMAGGVRTPTATITGHFNNLEASDPLGRIAADFLRRTLAHARRRATIRALEVVASYLEGFAAVERDA